MEFVAVVIVVILLWMCPRLWTSSIKRGVSNFYAYAKCTDKYRKWTLNTTPKSNNKESKLASSEML